MANIFFIGDTHFGHKNILKFQRFDGTLLRPGFASLEEMHEHIIQRWNETVKPKDKVYHLGDFEMGLSDLQRQDIGGRLNGHKRLILGNHDKLPVKKYLEIGFGEVYGSRQFEGVICTHIPIHPGSLSRWKFNIHGHLHANLVRLPFYIDYDEGPDPAYRNVSVECLDDYRPISLEEVKRG